MRALGMVLLGTFGVAFTAGAFTGSPVDIVLAIICWLWFASLWANGNPSLSGSRGKVEQLSQEAENWLERYRAGSLEAPSIGGLLIKKNETALLAAESTLRELVADKAHHYLGTRVHIGNTPIYLGRSSGSHAKHFRITDRGRYVITNRKLYFVGVTHTVAYKIEQILQITPTLNSVLVNIDGRANPIVLDSPNPLLFFALIRSLHQSAFADPA